MMQYRSKKPNEIISVESIVLLRHYGYIIVDKGAIGRAQREAVAQVREDNDNRKGWECPINYDGCTQNCGNYGCGN